MKNIPVIIFLSIFLTGCASVKNIKEAKLMPESTAKSILAKYSSPQWVDNPKGYEKWNWWMCDTGWHSMPFSTVNEVIRPIFNKQTILLRYRHFPCERVVLLTSTTEFTDDELNDVVDALVSLGAKISE